MLFLPFHPSKPPTRLPIQPTLSFPKPGMPSTPPLISFPSTQPTDPNQPAKQPNSQPETPPNKHELDPTTAPQRARRPSNPCGPCSCSFPAPQAPMYSHNPSRCGRSLFACREGVRRLVGRADRSMEATRREWRRTWREIENRQYSTQRKKEEERGMCQKCKTDFNTQHCREGKARTPHQNAEEKKGGIQNQRRWKSTAG